MSHAFDQYQQRVRRRAYELWERDGRPHGRADQHWALAREQIATEENIATTFEPNPLIDPPPTAEPLLAVEGHADIPGRFTDQGEREAYPDLRNR